MKIIYTALAIAGLGGSLLRVQADLVNGIEGNGWRKFGRKTGTRHNVRHGSIRTGLEIHRQQRVYGRSRALEVVCRALEVIYIVGVSIV